MAALPVVIVLLENVSMQLRKFASHAHLESIKTQRGKTSARNVQLVITNLKLHNPCVFPVCRELLVCFVCHFFFLRRLHVIYFDPLLLLHLLLLLLLFLSAISGTSQNETGQDACVQCIANSYSNNSASTTCTGCGVGEKSDPGAAKCLKCDAGEAGTGVNGACESCAPGRYRPSKDENEQPTNAEACSECPAGLSSDKGSTKCQPCEAGKYSEQVGGVCLSCTFGQYRVASMDPTKCNFCSVGFYQEEIGQAACLPCIPGTYSDVTSGAKICKVCEKNSYSNVKSRDTKCVPCASGRTSREGSVSCSSCAAGTRLGEIDQFGARGCVECKFSKFTSEIDQESCEQCKHGKTTTTEEGEGASSCSPCGLGKYGRDEGMCLNCPMGKK